MNIQGNVEQEVAFDNVERVVDSVNLSQQVSVCDTCKCNLDVNRCHPPLRLDEEGHRVVRCISAGAKPNTLDGTVRVRIGLEKSKQCELFSL